MSHGAGRQTLPGLGFRGPPGSPRTPSPPWQDRTGSIEPYTCVPTGSTRTRTATHGSWRWLSACAGAASTPGPARRRPPSTPCRCSRACPCSAAGPAPPAPSRSTPSSSGCPWAAPASCPGRPSDASSPGLTQPWSTSYLCLFITIYRPGDPLCLRGPYLPVPPGLLLRLSRLSLPCHQETRAAGNSRAS